MGMASVVACGRSLLLIDQLCACALVVQTSAYRCAGHSAQQQHQEYVMKILLAIDDSPYSADAVEEVATRPWPAGTTVRVLSAVDVTPIATEPAFVASLDIDTLRNEIARRYKEVMSRAAGTLQEKGLNVEMVVRDGDPRSVIVDEAKEWSANLVVVGSHGYTGVKRWLLGSVAHSVVSHAPCSVEVVRKSTTA
jgi:nucleotide-binding universal stress UspA family protein